MRLLRYSEEEHPLDLSHWERLVARVEAATRPVRMGIIGKYINLPDAYLSVVESLRHAGFHHGAKVEIEWIQAAEVPDLLAHDRLREFDGFVIPGGFGERGVKGMIAAAGYARDHEIPSSACAWASRSWSSRWPGPGRPGRRQLPRIRPTTPAPVIDLMDDQNDVVNMGGTMRLGSYGARLVPGSQVAEAYGTEVVEERHRHRYEVNPRFRHRLEEPAWCAREPPPMGGWSSSSSFPAIRSGWVPRRTRNSRAGPTDPIRFFESWSERRWPAPRVASRG